MIRCERARDIAATPEDLWAVIGRFMHIHEFAPRVVSVDALTEGEDGVGSKRRCVFTDGSSVIEEVTQWEPNRRYRVRMSEMASMPLHEATADIVVAPNGNGTSRVTWGMDYRVKYGPLGWLLGQTMMKSMMSKVLDANLEGLADKVGATRSA